MVNKLIRLLFLLIIVIFYKLINACPLIWKEALTYEHKESADPNHIHLRLCTAFYTLWGVYAYAYTPTGTESLFVLFEVQIRDEVEQYVLHSLQNAIAKVKKNLLTATTFDEKLQKCDDFSHFFGFVCTE